MTVAWRIDSLDARAGLAVASFRTADLEGEASPLDQPAVFLSPPSFAPEALASRATGFAAARGRAQLGLFIEEREVGFESLEALTEFVRRLYAGGGAGDGPGGEPGPRFPAPEGPESPDGETPRPEAVRPSELLHGLIVMGKRARETISGLRLDEHRTAPTAQFEVTPVRIAPEDAGAAMAQGAGELLLDLFISWRSDGASEAQRQLWRNQYRSLTGAIAGLGLGTAVRRTPTWPTIRETALMIDVDRVLGIAGSLHPRWRHLLDFDDLLLMSMQGGDPLDELSSWTIPDSVARLAEIPERPASALALLTAVCAAPQRLAETNPRDAQSAASIALFASARIVRGGARVRPQVWDGPSDHAALADEAVAWMTRQWPKLVFPDPLETWIRSAAALR